MASTALKPTRTPQPRPQAQAPVSAATYNPGLSATAMYPQRSGAGNQANLEALARERSAQQPLPLPAAPERKPLLRLPPLSRELRAEMVADVEHITAILKKGTPNTGNQTNLLEVVRRWAQWDRDLSEEERGHRRTPFLDHFLILLKSRAFSRVTFRVPFTDRFTIEQYAIVYDTLWYELRGGWLLAFKRIIQTSETQRTEGAESKDIENGAALLAKQEAMGLWGMLKGMGTGLVSLAGPRAVQYISGQFDESARILFGHEWDSAEPLVWGMNAGQIGTAGGDVIMQLTMFARTAGAKGGKVLELLTNLDRLKNAQRGLAAMGGVQGVLMASQGIAEVIDAKKKTGHPITAEALLEDKAFVNHLTTLLSSGVSIMLAAKGAPSGTQETVTRARIALLLSTLQVTSALADLARIAQSDVSDTEKHLEYGQVVAGLIPQLVDLILAGHGHAQAKKEPPPGAAEPGHSQEPKNDASTEVRQPAPKPPDHLPPTTPVPEAAPKATPPTPKAPAPTASSAPAVPAPTFGSARKKALSNGDISAPPGKRPSRKRPSPTASPETPVVPSRNTPDFDASASPDAPLLLVDRPLSPHAPSPFAFPTASEAAPGKPASGTQPKREETARLGPVRDDALLSPEVAAFGLEKMAPKEAPRPQLTLSAPPEASTPAARPAAPDIPDRRDHPASTVVTLELAGPASRAATDSTGSTDGTTGAAPTSGNETARLSAPPSPTESEGPVVVNRQATAPASTAPSVSPPTQAKDDLATDPQWKGQGTEKAEEAARQKPAKNDHDFADVRDALSKPQETHGSDGPELLVPPPTSERLVAVRFRGDSQSKGTFIVGPDLPPGHPPFADDPKAEKKAKKEYLGRASKKFRQAAANKKFLLLPESEARALGFVEQGKTFRSAAEDKAFQERTQAKGPVAPSFMPLQQNGKPVESSKAASNSHPISARTGGGKSQAKRKKAYEGTIQPSLEENDSYRSQILEKKELGLKRAGNASEKGADHVTVDIQGNPPKIFLNDATTPDQRKGSKDTHKDWYKQLEKDFPRDANGTRDFGFADPEINKKLNAAFDAGEVYVRILRPVENPAGSLSAHPVDYKDPFPKVEYRPDEKMFQVGRKKPQKK